MSVGNMSEMVLLSKILSGTCNLVNTSFIMTESRSPAVKCLESLYIRRYTAQYC